MPTLMETAAPVPHVEQAPPVSAPAALTLTFGGVEFALTPTDTNAELSYKNKGQDIILSLSSFTGSLKVSLKGINAALPQLQQTTATVEEEPNSPQVAQKAPSFMPGQTKLSFQKKQTAKSKERKRTAELVTPKSSAKKSRKNASTKTTAVPTLCQTMEKPTQATQDLPDLSQTMPSQSEVGSDSALYQTPSSSSATTDVKRNASVREILDRVNSSNDSVATIQDDDENSIASKPDKPSLEIIEDEKKEAPANTKNDTTATAAAAVPMVLDDDPKKIPSPSPRWGHTMTKIKGDRVLVYGGQSFDLEGNPVFLDDVHVYNTSKRTWEKPIQCRGDKRQWHSATFLPERQLLISFGGETMDPIKKSKVVTSDTLRVLDTDIMLWYPPAVSGDVPTGRSGHTATLLPNTNELVLFGGVKGARWLNTVSVLNTVRWVWTTPKVEGMAPKPRSYQSATAVKGSGNSYKLVIFGGNNKTSCFDSVHVLEAGENNNWKWSNPKCTGKAPFPRTGHSATLLDDGKTICIYGGWDPNEEDSNGEENIFKGSFLLDTSTWTWSGGPKATPGGSGSEYFVEDCGPKRCGHTSVLNPQCGEVMVFGGRIPGEILAGDFQKLSTSSEQVVGLDG